MVPTPSGSYARLRNEPIRPTGCRINRSKFACPEEELWSCLSLRTAASAEKPSPCSHADCRRCWGINDLRLTRSRRRPSRRRPGPINHAQALSDGGSAIRLAAGRPNHCGIARSTSRRPAIRNVPDRRAAAGIAGEHIAYKSGPETVQSVVSGQVNVTLIDLPLVLWLDLRVGLASGVNSSEPRRRR